MNNIRKIIGIFAGIGLIVCIIFAASRTANGKFDGGTKESREAILSSGGTNQSWSILFETEVEGYLACAIAYEDERGIAIFEPLKNGNYGYVTRILREGSEIVSLPVHLKDNYYLLIYADIPNPDYAEVTFTVEEEAQTPIRLDAASGGVLFAELPSTEFEADIRYYDRSGTLYQ